MKFARAKGLSNARVIGVHVLRNILIPIVTVIGLEFGSVIAFAIVTESVFAWPGMGKLLIDSINLLDRPIIVAYLLVIVLMFIVINLVVDVLYSALDPRVRLTETQELMQVGADAAAAHRRRFRRQSGRCVRPGGARRSSSLIALFAPLISPQNPYDLAQLDVMDSRLPPRSPAGQRRHLLARHRRPGTRHALGDLLRPAHQPRGRRDRAPCWRWRSACRWGSSRRISAAGPRR